MDQSQPDMIVNSNPTDSHARQTDYAIFSR